MRLVFISSEFPPGPGGIGTHACQLASHLQKLNGEVMVLASQDYSSEEEIKTFNDRQPFRIVRFNPVPVALFEAVYRYRIASRWIREFKPDLIIASGMRSVWLSAVLSRRFHLPFVAIGHGTEFGTSVVWERRLTRWSYEKAAAVVCVSHFTWNRMLAGGITPRLGTVIPNGADDQRFTLLPREALIEFRRSMNLQEGQLLLTVGNVSERKGQDIVIRSLPLILKEISTVHYLIVGLPSRKEYLMNLARELNVQDHVHFLGRVSNDSLVRILNCTDVFVMTSRHTSDGDFEGYGIAAVEAALCGKPAVVSDNSGLAEAIVDGETGFTVPENDSIATGQTILSLLRDPEKRRKMGDAARKRAMESQTWSQRANAYNKFFRDVFHRTTSNHLAELSKGQSSINSRP